jgi:hypothetical protein
MGLMKTRNLTLPPTGGGDDGKRWGKNVVNFFNYRLDEKTEIFQIVSIFHLMFFFSSSVPFTLRRSTLPATHAERFKCCGLIKSFPIYLIGELCENL